MTASEGKIYGYLGFPGVLKRTEIQNTYLKKS